MKNIIGNPSLKNKQLQELIKKTSINNFYIKNQKDFREQILIKIDKNDDVLDIGKGMRDKFNKIISKSIETLDVNQFNDYPDIVFDLCDNLNESLKKKYDKIICLAILEHVYDPFKAVYNMKEMLKINGMVFGYVPFLYQYHAPNDLKFQDYFRFTKDGLSYLFKDFSNIEIFPIRGRISTPFHILFSSKWKKYIEKLNINILIDKLATDENNAKQCSGFNFILKK